MSFPRFPKYKDSGIPWLGELPDEWEVIKLSRRLDKMPCYGVLVPNYVDEGVPMLRINDIEEGIASRERLKNITPELSEEFSRTVLEEGDIALAVVGTIGRSLIVSQELVGCNLSRAVARVIPGKGLSSQMLRWIFESLGFRHYTDLTCVGTAQRVLNMNSLSSFSIAVPNTEIQASIDKFLSRETSKIDALIAEQQRLIELLQEKRQSVISHAVAKGLNPNAPMKDSGVESLGEVPEHWEVMQVRRITESHKQGFYSNEGYVEEGVKLLRITDIQDDASIDTSESPNVDANSVPNDFLLEEGDFVFARTGGAGSYGFIGKLGTPTAFASYLIRFRFAASIEPGFLRLYFLSKHFLEGIASNIHGGVNQNVHAEDIKNQWLALAPKEEQQAIASKVFRVLDRYAALGSSIEDEIRLLNERRSALISAAVTGQIDVRGLMEREGGEQ